MVWMQSPPSSAIFNYLLFIVTLTVQWGEVRWGLVAAGRRWGDTPHSLRWPLLSPDYTVGLRPSPSSDLSSPPAVLASCGLQAGQPSWHPTSPGSVQARFLNKNNMTLSSYWLISLYKGSFCAELSHGWSLPRLEIIYCVYTMTGMSVEQFDQILKLIPFKPSWVERWMFIVYSATKQSLK